MSQYGNWLFRYIQPVKYYSANELKFMLNITIGISKIIQRELNYFCKELEMLKIENTTSCRFINKVYEIYGRIARDNITDTELKMFIESVKRDKCSKQKCICFLISQQYKQKLQKNDLTSYNILVNKYRDINTTFPKCALKNISVNPTKH